MKRPLPFGSAAWLVVLWLLLWADLSVANVASGVAVAVAVLFVTSGIRAPSLGRTGWPNLVAIIRLVGFVLRQLVVATAAIAWDVVTPQDRSSPGTVIFELRTPSDLACLVLSGVITLTPGTLVVDVRRVEGGCPVLHVHVLRLLDRTDLDAELRRIERLVVDAVTPVGRLGPERSRAGEAGR